MAEQCDTKAWDISLAEKNWKNRPPPEKIFFGRTGLGFGRKKWLAPPKKCPRNAYVHIDSVAIAAAMLALVV